MNEEIKKVSCSSCGGQLAIDPKQALAECPYCGNVYVISELLDRHPACPICEKSDRVVQTASISKEDYRYKALRFKLEDFHLPDDEPELDDHSKALGILGWVMVILPLILLQFFFSKFSDQPALCLIPLGISILLGVGLFTNTVNQYNASKAKKAEKENIREALKELNKIEYNRLKPIYERLYYCRRDDIVFLPNMGDYAKPEALRKYLRDHAWQKKNPHPALSLEKGEGFNLLSLAEGEDWGEGDN